MSLSRLELALIIIAVSIGSKYEIAAVRIVDTGSGANVDCLLAVLSGPVEGCIVFANNGWHKRC